VASRNGTIGDHEFLRVWWDCMVFLTYDRTHVVADLREEMPAKMDV
jgi:hypothetical protein